MFAVSTYTDPETGEVYENCCPGCGEANPMQLCCDDIFTDSHYGRGKSFTCQRCIAAYWAGDRMGGCPACGSDDFGTIGNGTEYGALNNDTHNRTDANLSDGCICNACGFEHWRSMADAESERLREALLSWNRPTSRAYWHYIMAFRMDRQMSEHLQRFEQGDV